MADKANPATRNRRVRQEALRDYLESRGLVDHVIDLADKLDDESNPIAPDMVARMKVSIDTRLKLINKYLPDLKQTELIGDAENPLQINPANLSDDQLAAIIAISSSN